MTNHETNKRSTASFPFTDEEVFEKKIAFLVKQQELMGDVIQEKMESRDGLLTRGRRREADELNKEIGDDRDYQSVLFRKILKLHQLSGINIHD